MHSFRRYLKPWDLVVILLLGFTVWVQGSYIIGPPGFGPIFPSTGIPSFVQSKFNVTAAATSIAVSFTTLPAITNVVIVGLESGTGNTAESVTDNQGNAYSKLTKIPADLAAGAHGTMWCAPVVVSAGTFTITGTTSSIVHSIFILEYKNGTCNLDVLSGAAGSTSPYSCGSLTTRNANDLIVAFLAFQWGGGGTITYTAPSGFTIRESQTDGATFLAAGSIADKIVSATGTFNGTYSTGGKDNVSQGCMQVALLSH